MRISGGSALAVPRAAAEFLQGAVERVTFHSEASGFCVLRVQAKGHRDVVTVIGRLASISPGEYLECSGAWVVDRQHGLQFHAEQLRATPPSTREGIEKYLGSGMVRGIGPHFAKKLVGAFGEAVFDVIEQTPERLLDLEGIGQKRQQSVVSAWAEQKTIRTIMVFLQSHGIGTSRAVRIYKTYGEEAVAVVRANPYRLALDIRGIGFKTADALAEQLGIARDSLIRARAGVRHVLHTLCEAGHCAAPYPELVKASVTLLGIEEGIIQTALAEEVHEKNLIEDDIAGVHCVFPAALYHAEQGAAQLLQALQHGALPWGTLAVAAQLRWAEQKTHLQLSPSQQAAIGTLLRHKVSILTGGPGVGKSTILCTLVTILRAQKLRLGLCAPTGRAAKRLSEATGLPAQTLHRLLAFDPHRYAFTYDAEHPLPMDIVIVDEASMLDSSLLYKLLKAIPLQAALMCVGDVDQLPSVGSGAVLADMIRSHRIPTVRLTEIFRQAADSQIIVNAHRIHQGHLPCSTLGESDFYTVYRDTPEDIITTVLHLVAERIPRRFAVNPITSIQVLTPMKRGSLGSMALNVALQQRLNGSRQPHITRFGWTFAPGDKVIQTTNNYEKEVFNGDIGVVTALDLEQGELHAQFEERSVIYAFQELDELQLAYAISVHKSQGSEFPVVIVPLCTQHYTLLARNLLYTAVTRGKKLVILVGQKQAIAMAVRNNRETQRLTSLTQRLQASA